MRTDNARRSIFTMVEGLKLTLVENYKGLILKTYNVWSFLWLKVKNLGLNTYKSRITESTTTVVHFSCLMFPTVEI